MPVARLTRYGARLHRRARTASGYRMVLLDGTAAASFTADPTVTGAAPDISARGGWRAHLPATRSTG